MVEILEQPKKLELRKEEIKRIAREKPRILEPKFIPLRDVLPAKEVEELEVDVRIVLLTRGEAS